MWNITVVWMLSLFNLAEFQIWQVLGANAIRTCLCWTPCTINFISSFSCICISNGSSSSRTNTHTKVYWPNDHYTKHFFKQFFLVRETAMFVLQLYSNKTMHFFSLFFYSLTTNVVLLSSSLELQIDKIITLQIAFHKTLCYLLLIRCCWLNAPFNHMASVYLAYLQADFARFKAQLQSSLVVTDLFEKITTKQTCVKKCQQFPVTLSTTLLLHYIPFLSLLCAFCWKTLNGPAKI